MGRSSPQSLRNAHSSMHVKLLLCAPNTSPPPPEGISTGLRCASSQGLQLTYFGCSGLHAAACKGTPQKRDLDCIFVTCSWSLAEHSCSHPSMPRCFAQAPGLSSFEVRCTLGVLTALSFPELPLPSFLGCNWQGKSLLGCNTDLDD